MNKTGIQSGVLYDDSNYEWGLEIVKNAGFDCIDFNIDTKINYSETCKGKADEFFTKSDEELKEYYRPQKEAMEKFGISMSQMHGPFPIFCRDNQEATDILVNATEKCLMLCQYFGCPYLVVHPSKGENSEDEKEINMYLYKRLIPAAKKYGIGICLENMFKSVDGHTTEAVCSDISQACEYIDELNEIAGEKIFSFCYDLGHATLLGKDVRRSINMLGSRLTVLHIHDNNGIKDIHLQPYSQTVGCRSGYITDWEGFVEGLKDIDFKGVLSFETFNALTGLPKELYPVMVNYVGGVAKYFAERISK